MKVLYIDNHNYLFQSQKKIIISISLQIMEYLKLPDNTELCISIINDQEMRELNNRYKSIDRTTDILSFSQELNEYNFLIGDLVISFETAKRHSEKYGITMEIELIKLLTHGILHLIGYDHKKKKETQLMREKEKEIIKILKM